MAKKTRFTDDDVLEAAPIAAPPEVAPAPQPKPPEKKNLPVLQMVCAAIAAFRKNDSYSLINTANYVQYRNGAKRLVVNVSKLAESDVSQRDTKSLSKANAFLEIHKNFTEANVFTVKRGVGNIFIVVTTDGEKYYYDITTNALI